MEALRLGAASGFDMTTNWRMHSGAAADYSDGVSVVARSQQQHDFLYGTNIRISGSHSWVDTWQRRWCVFSHREAAALAAHVNAS